MREYIAFDCHKHYTLAERQDIRTGHVKQCRIDHCRGAIRHCLRGRACELYYLLSHVKHSESGVVCSQYPLR